MTPHWIKISELDTELFYAVGDGKVFAKLYIGINDNYRIALRNDKAQFSQEIELTESDRHFIVTMLLDANLVVGSRV
jgi:hypothetical protein